MSTLPPDFINGNILSAGELNTMLSARDGNITPIDPATKVEVDNLYDIGAPTKRFKDGHFSGSLRADKQPLVKSFAIPQVKSASFRMDFSAPAINKGDITFSSPHEFNFISLGVYLVHFHFEASGSTLNGNIRIQLNRPALTVVEDWKTDFTTLGSSPSDVKPEGTISGIVIPQVGDKLDFLVDPKGSITTSALSKITIIRLL